MADEKTEEISTQVKDGKLEVTKTVSEATVASFDYDYLVKQRASIQAQKDRDNAQRDKELAEVDTLILAAKAGGLDTPKADSGGAVDAGGIEAAK